MERRKVSWRIKISETRPLTARPSAGRDAGGAFSVIRIATAGWSIPRTLSEKFPEHGSSLERYAGVFNSVEINSTFYRPHKPSTFARWAASVPENFRFSVKAPREITHVKRLVDCNAAVAKFFDETDYLGAKRGPILMQLPPSLPFIAPRPKRFSPSSAIDIPAPRPASLAIRAGSIPRPMRCYAPIASVASPLIPHPFRKPRAPGALRA